MLVYVSFRVEKHFYGNMKRLESIDGRENSFTKHTRLYAINKHLFIFRKRVQKRFTHKRFGY